MRPGRALLLTTMATLSTALVALAACRSKDDERKAVAPPNPAGTSVPGFAVPPLLATSTWSKIADLSSFGVPAGCVLERPVQRMTLPKGAVRFIAPRGSDGELLLAVDENGDGEVDRDALLDAQGRSSRALPWKTLASPPLLARSRDGYLALAVEDTGGGTRRASVWHEPGRLEPLVDGEKLEATEAACDAAGCAVLLTHASASAGPGATAFFRAASAAPGAPWTRIELPGENEGFAPFSIVGVKERGAVFALEALPLIAVWEAVDGKVTSLGRLTSQFGAYDVAYDPKTGKAPFAVVPSESIDQPCTMDGFNVRLVDAKGKTTDVFGQVPPSEVLTRTLGKGFIVAWLAPVSCRHEGQSIVRAFLVDEDGKPASSTMAVTDGDGFALSTVGDRVNLWVSRRGTLEWATMQCHPSPAP